MKSGYGKGERGKATRLHSLVVRSRGACERCGETDYSKLQCAHTISRRYSATRTDETNAFCLCARCHMYLTEHPFEFVQFVISKIGQDGYDRLLDKARQPAKVDWGAEVVRLQTLLAEIQEAA